MKNMKGLKQIGMKDGRRCGKLDGLPGADVLQGNETKEAAATKIQNVVVGKSHQET